MSKNEYYENIKFSKIYKLFNINPPIGVLSFMQRNSNNSVWLEWFVTVSCYFTAKRNQMMMKGLKKIIFKIFDALFYLFLMGQYYEDEQPIFAIITGYVAMIGIYVV